MQFEENNTGRWLVVIFIAVAVVFATTALAWPYWDVAVNAIHAHTNV